MDLYEIQETIKKHITIIKRTIVKPFNFDVVVKVPNKNGQKREGKAEQQEKEI